MTFCGTRRYTATKQSSLSQGKLHLLELIQIFFLSFVKVEILLMFFNQKEY